MDEDTSVYYRPVLWDDGRRVAGQLEVLWGLQTRVRDAVDHECYPSWSCPWSAVPAASASGSGLAGDSPNDDLPVLSGSGSALSSATTDAVGSSERSAATAASSRRLVPASPPVRRTKLPPLAVQALDGRLVQCVEGQQAEVRLVRALHLPVVDEGAQDSCG